MKVKVRKRRSPAPVAAEQVKKKSDSIVVKFVVGDETISEMKFTQQTPS